MRRHLLLLAALWMIWSLCLSPTIEHFSEQVSAVVAGGEEAPSLQAGLFVPPVQAGFQAAPPVAGSVNSSSADAEASAQAEPDEAPPVILTPERNFIEPDNVADGALRLWGTGTPNKSIELSVNDDFTTLQRLSVQRDGTWDADIPVENLREGEVELSMRYAGAAETATWRSRYARDLLRVTMPAHVPLGTRSFRGRVAGDVSTITASANGVALPCVLDVNGGFTVVGMSSLPLGTEVVLTAVDDAQNAARAICMVVQPSAAVLQYETTASQMHLSAKELDDRPAQAQASAGLADTTQRHSFFVYGTTAPHDLLSGARTARPTPTSPPAATALPEQTATPKPSPTPVSVLSGTPVAPSPTVRPTPQPEIVAGRTDEAEAGTDGETAMLLCSLDAEGNLVIRGANELPAGSEIALQMINMAGNAVKLIYSVVDPQTPLSGDDPSSPSQEASSGTDTPLPRATDAPQDGQATEGHPAKMLEPDAPTGTDRLSTPEQNAEMPAQIADMIRVAQQEEAAQKKARLPASNKYTLWFYNDARRVGWSSNFVGWCANEAGIPLVEDKGAEAIPESGPMLFNASKASAMYSAFKRAGRLSNIPRPGYVVVYGVVKSNNATHVGLVESVTEIGDGVYELTTIEGNVSSTIKRYCIRYVSDPKSMRWNLRTVPQADRTRADAQYKLHQNNWFISGFGQTW